jgi:hypothetical protein
LYHCYQTLSLYYDDLICQTYQLHGEEGEREDLRRVIPGVPTIKANEVLGDVCVVQQGTERRAKAGKENQGRAPTATMGKRNLPASEEEPSTPKRAKLMLWLDALARCSGSVLWLECSGLSTQVL